MTDPSQTAYRLVTATCCSQTHTSPARLLVTGRLVFTGLHRSIPAQPATDGFGRLKPPSNRSLLRSSLSAVLFCQAQGRWTRDADEFGRTVRSFAARRARARLTDN